MKTNLTLTLLVVLCLITFNNVSAQVQSVDTTFKYIEKKMVFKPGYNRKVECMYVGGKLRRKTIKIICVKCTYKHAVKTRIREYK